MRGSMTNFLENELVDHVLRNLAYTSPTSVLAALYTAFPGEAGGGTEVAGNGYARQTVTFGAPSDGVSSNSAAVTFGPATPAAWGVILAWTIFDQTTNPLFHGPVAEASFEFFAEDGAVDTLSVDANPFVNDNEIWLKGTNLPTGLSEDTKYFVVGTSGFTFQLSLTKGGAAIDLTSEGDGNVALTREKDIEIDDSFEFAIGDLEIALE